MVLNCLQAKENLQGDSLLKPLNTHEIMVLLRFNLERRKAESTLKASYGFDSGEGPFLPYLNDFQYSTPLLRKHLSTSFLIEWIYIGL